MTESADISTKTGLFSPENAPKSPVFGHETGENNENSSKFNDLQDDFDDIEAIEVNSELAALYSTAKRLLDNCVTDNEVPTNQKAQVLNSTLAIVERITKLRTDLYNADRLRKLEQTLIRTLRDFPRELQEEFMKAYERNLTGSS